MASLPEGDDWKKGDEEAMSVIKDCLCMNCGKQAGTTYVLPTKIPMFREIIVMSFECGDCGFRNSEVTFGGEIQEKGERLDWTVTGPDDLQRQLIKSDSASLQIPSLQLEIPPGTQKGTISTVEGFLKRAAENLELLQPERLRLGDVDNFHRCRQVISGLRQYAGEAQEDDEDDEDDEDEGHAESPFPFVIILDDPAGNSYIENPHAPSPDPNLKSTKYVRSATQDMSLGLQPSQQAIKDGTIDDANPSHKNPANAAGGAHTIEVVDSTTTTTTTTTTNPDETGAAVTDTDTPKSIREEVLKFPTQCPHCHRPAETDMCLTDIPHFKEVIIMSLLCEHCGFKSNEIKGGGAIPKFGTKITLAVQSSHDMSREILKSDTAGVSIPELELELDEGGLDGLYTTVEGLLHKMHQRLEMANPFGSGDAAKKHHLDNDGGSFSQVSPNHQRYLTFLQKLHDMASGTSLPFTLIISDPLSNSFIGPVPQDAVALALQAEKDGHNGCYDDYVDNGMVIEEYERSNDQNEILGLNDIKTENYREESGVNYGTDAPQELPDRLQRLDVRGPDHPHAVGKAPVEGDNTVMGAGSVQFAVPALAQRGIPGQAPPQEHKQDAQDDAATVAALQDTSKESSDVVQLLHDFEMNDGDFRMNDEYNGSVSGMVFKDGAQGLGYYTDVPLDILWTR